MHRHIAALIIACAASACAGRAEVTYRDPLPTTTTMVEVDPGVFVVADQREPTFYANNFYWRYHDNSWYRIGGTTGEWMRIGRPPETVLRIREPQRYTRYRASSGDTVVIRDQRGRIQRR